MQSGNDDVGNMVLLPKAARKLNVPFLASGGIADGKQLAGALAMGCDGINMVAHEHIYTVLDGSS